MKKLYWFGCVLGLILTACFKDEGNYIYHDINEVQISGLPEEMKIYYRNVDTLRAEPVVSGNLDEGDQSRYYYEWKAVSRSTGAESSSSFILGTEKKLNYFVVLPDNEYDIYCCVKDTLTRVTWNRSFPIRVTTELNAGWLVLSELQGNCKLDLISLSAKQNVVVHDVFQDFPDLKGPKALQSCYNMNNAQYNTDPRFYLMSESGCYKLNVSDYTWNEEGNIFYEMMEYPVDYSPTLRAAGYGWEFIASPRSAYGVSKPYGVAGPFGLPCNHLTNSEEYFDIAEAIGYYPHYYYSNGARVVYDITNRRFLKLANNMLSCEEIVAQETYFPWVTGKDFVYMGNTPYDGGSTYTILKDPVTGKLAMYMMRIASGISQRKYVELDEAPEIDKATCFAVYPASNWLFYAVENTVYQYDLNGHFEKIVFADEKITFLKFHIFTGLSADENIQRQLVVGTIDNTLDELNGHMYFYKVPTSWGDRFEVIGSYDSFGIPVDVVYVKN